MFNLEPWETFGAAVEGIEESHYIEFPEKRLKYYRLLGEGQNWRDLPEEIQPEAMGKSYYLGGGKTGFYRRLSFDRPAPTLVTNPTMPATDLCHPVENRPLSIEEYKRVQGFPDDWYFCGKLLDVYKQIGNAVPIELGRAVARAIISDIEGHFVEPIQNFPYSRYNRTDEISFMEDMEKVNRNK